MSSLIFSFNTLAPLILIAFLGYVLKQKGMFNASFTALLNKYIFYVALPVLAFRAIAFVDRSNGIHWPFIVFATGALMVVLLLGFLVLPLLRLSDNEKPVVMQGFVRGNFIIVAIPLSLRLGGEEALSVIILLNVLLIPLSNIMSITIFKFFQKEVNGWGSFPVIMRETSRNPIMIAIALGLVALLAQPLWLPYIVEGQFLYDTLSLLGATATPMALLAIGSSLQFGQFRAYIKPVLTVTIARLVLIPIGVFIVAHLIIDWAGTVGYWPALIALFASPVAASSVAVTQGLKGDERIASQLVLWTTLVSMVTYFIYISFFASLGYF
jgi:predicted permease